MKEAPRLLVLRLKKKNTHTNTNTSATQLTASLGPYTACPGPLCQLEEKVKTSSTVCTKHNLDLDLDIEVPLQGLS